MEIIRSLCAILFLMFLFYRSGILAKKIIKSENTDIFTTIIYGFVVAIALFECIAIPFNIFNLNVLILYCIELIAWAATIVLSYVIKLKEKKYNLKIKEEIKQIKNYNLKEKIFMVIFISIIIFQIGNSVYLQRSDADDAFYVSWSEQAKNLEQYTQTEPSTGQENSTFSKMYILNSWETLNGFIAKTFNISTPKLLHTFCPILIISISYMGYWLLIKKVTNNKNPYLMAIIFSIIILFDGVSARFRGSLLLGRSYQGKAIVLNIILTFILYKLINYKQLKKEDIVILAITNLAAIALNPISIWLIPIVYFLFGVYLLIKLDIKTIMKLVAILIPNIIILPIFIICSVLTSSGGISVDYINSYKDIIIDFIRDGKLYILIYAICCIYILAKGNKNAKLICVYIPIIAFLTILNPFVSKYVQKYVTSAATYWRLLWIIPLEIGISYTIYEIYEQINNAKLKNIILITFIFIICICGKYMYQEECLFYKHENLEKIDNNIVKQTEYIVQNSNDKVLVIAPKEPYHGTNMRQISTNIILFYSRPMYATLLEEYTQKDQIYYQIYRDNEVEAIYEIIDKWKADFIILDKNDNSKIIEKIDTTRVPIGYEDEENIIFYNKNSEKIKIETGV